MGQTPLLDADAPFLGWNAAEIALKIRPSDDHSRSHFRPLKQEEQDSRFPQITWNLTIGLVVVTIVRVGPVQRDGRRYQLLARLPARSVDGDPSGAFHHQRSTVHRGMLVSPKMFPSFPVFPW